ncbi:enoyl-CoA hydratase-related protein [Sphingobium sp. JS3065]|uniref:enoyl-CoA hydratase-related protein n=1 Tax=Sphingobium sp. JS3065 TaxID=2970925 RepID=UPI002263DF2D|nr:enoyl-CoA hydratase-related protein [Sphingobium sp. JS3065]UZW56980.1 enoyl-CoA hydratase-related protein [Sphingobium sp. JS3065]
MALALMGDVIVAATDAYFLAPFAKLCLAPDSGVSFLLTRALGRTGPSKARWARISTFGAEFRANCRARPIAWRASPLSANGARHAS